MLSRLAEPAAAGPGYAAVQRQADGTGVQEPAASDPAASASAATLSMPALSGPPGDAGTGPGTVPPSGNGPVPHAVAGIASVARAAQPSDGMVVRAAARPAGSAPSLSGPLHRNGGMPLNTALADTLPGSRAGAGRLPVVAAASSFTAPTHDGASLVLAPVRAEAGSGRSTISRLNADADVAPAVSLPAGHRGAEPFPVFSDGGGPAAVSAPRLQAGPLPHVARRPAASADAAGGAPAGSPMPLARQGAAGGGSASASLVARAPSPGAEPQPPYELPGAPAMPQPAASGPGTVRPGAPGDGGAAPGGEAGGVDMDEIVERAWRAVMQRLAIEQERRGLRRWS